MKNQVIIYDPEVLEVLQKYSILVDPEQERTQEEHAVCLILERLRDSTMQMEEELTEMGIYEYFKDRIIRLAVKYGLFVPKDTVMN